MLLLVVLPVCLPYLHLKLHCLKSLPTLLEARMLSTYLTHPHVLLKPAAYCNVRTCTRAPQTTWEQYAEPLYSTTQLLRVLIANLSFKDSEIWGATLCL